MTVAVCDDEPLMREELSAGLARYMEGCGRTGCQIRCFDSGSALLQSACDFDLVLLDIRMARPDGMETARRLRQRGYRGLLVFVTVLGEYVFDAFAVQAFDYLVKPLDSARFARVMDRAVRYLEREKGGSLLLRRGSACQVIPFCRIVYCEVIGRKVFVHQADGTVAGYYERLDRLESRLDGRFFRCHRSYLVNLDYVRGCGAGQVMLPEDGAIPVSRLRAQALSQALLRHMKERGR